MGRVTDRLIVDLSEDGRVSVGTWLENHLPQPGEFRDLGWPLDKDALEDLRWYLEDYLRAPFGVYEDRGAQVEDHLAGWGRRYSPPSLATAPRETRTCRCASGRWN